MIPLHFVGRSSAQEGFTRPSYVAHFDRPLDGNFETHCLDNFDSTKAFHTPARVEED